MQDPIGIPPEHLIGQVLSSQGLGCLCGDSLFRSIQTRPGWKQIQGSLHRLWPGCYRQESSSGRLSIVDANLASMNLSMGGFGMSRNASFESREYSVHPDSKMGASKTGNQGHLVNNAPASSGARPTLLLHRALQTGLALRRKALSPSFMSGSPRPHRRGRIPRSPSFRSKSMPRCTASRMYFTAKGGLPRPLASFIASSTPSLTGTTRSTRPIR